jgi:excisionase family DNA binding protein
VTRRITPADVERSGSNHAGPRLLSAQAAARYLGIPYTSLRDIVFRGHLPVVRVPDCRRWWFDRHDLDRAVDRWKERRDS